MTDQNPAPETQPTKVTAIPEYNPHMASQEWLHEGIRKAKAEDWKKTEDAKEALATRIAEHLHRNEDYVWDLTFTKSLAEMQRDYDILRYYIPVQENTSPSPKSNNVKVARNYNVGLNVGVGAVLIGTGARIYMVLTSAGFTTTPEAIQVFQDMLLALSGIALIAISVALFEVLSAVRRRIRELHYQRSQNATVLKLRAIFRRNKQ